MAGFTVDIVRGDPGTKTDRSQQRALGEKVYDSYGRTWSYVRWDATGTFGELVRDGVGSDLVGSTRTVSGAVAVGREYLLDNNTFTDAIGAKIIGSIGFITGGTGNGQTFIITDRIANNDDRMRIRVLADRDVDPGDAGPGWERALSSSSIYDLIGPGCAYLAGAAGVHLRGFLQRDVVSADLTKYGYVLQAGFGFGSLDVSGVAVGTNRLLVAAAGGMLIGAASNAGAPVAISLLGDATSSTDTLIPIDARIENNMVATHPVNYGHPIDQHLDIN